MCDRRKKFVILAEQSSGSNMLKSAFENHSGTVMFGELFMPLVDRDNYNDSILPCLPKLLTELPFYFRYKKIRDKYPYQFITCVARKYSKGSYFGFKLMLKQNDQLTEKLISSRDWKKIILCRENMLAAYASRQHARKTGSGNVLKWQEFKNKKIVFNKDDFERFCKSRYLRREELDKLLNKYSADHIKLFYPEITSHNELEKVFIYLDYESAYKPKIDTRKRNANNIIGRYVNTEDVYRYIKSINKCKWLYEEAHEH
jgi:hypothetical protein